MPFKISLFFVLILGQLQAGDLYSILLCDTYAANISESIENDSINMRKEISRIQLYTQMRSIEINFNGLDLFPSDIYEYLSNLQFNPDDVVIFYFTGHGYRTPSKINNPWPNLYCSIAGQGIDFREITNLLLEKNPRLLLSLCDCCNNSIPDPVAPDVVSRDWAYKLTESQVKSNYEKLYLETSGLIMIRSSEVGEYSWCNSKGAIYTLALLDSLQYYIRNYKDVYWDTILTGANKKVIKYQKPVYELAIN